MFVNKRLDMGKHGGHLFKSPNIPAEIHCKGCDYYEKQEEFSRVLILLFGRSGAWDYAQCYESCPKKEKKRSAHHKEYQKEWLKKRKEKCASGVL